MICTNDLRAHEVLLTASALGLSVPDQLSVISFDDMIAAYTSPPLCSFDPHIHDVGVAATALLGEALRGELPEPRRIPLPLEFRCRSTCGPATRQTSPRVGPIRPPQAR